MSDREALVAAIFVLLISAALFLTGGLYAHLAWKCMQFGWGAVP